MNYFHKQFNNITKERREDFILAYEWKLKDYGESGHKIVTNILLKDYYKAGLHCIDNNISISKFIRECIADGMKKNIKTLKKRTDKKPILQKTKELKEVEKIRDSQGTLF